MQEEDPHSAALAARRCEQAIAFIMASVRLDAPAAEQLLAALAQRTGRPAAEVADDLVRGRTFAGRPSWL